MSNITRQQQADLAVDAYNIRTVTKEGEEGIRISGNRYKILAIHNNRSTGYHGTVYQDVRSNEIIVAHREDGTRFRRLARCLYRLDDGLQQCQLSGC